MGDSAWSCCGSSWFQKLHPAATDPAGLHTQPVLEAFQEAVSSWIPGTRNATNNKGGVSHVGGSAERNLAQEGKRSLGAKSLFGIKMAPS